MAIVIRPILKAEVSSMLKLHIPQKIANRGWLLPCLNEQYAEFPYIHKEKEASVAKIIFIPTNQPTRNPDTQGSQLPFYLVNVPHAHRQGAQGYESLLKLLNLYKNESFGLTALESENEIKNRFSLVVGVNQMQSLDQGVNLDFEDWIANIPVVEGIAYRIIGFNWVPNWIKTAEAPPLTYPPMTAFTLLKQFSREAALHIRTRLEGTAENLNEKILSQIPIQRIREKIKDSPQTTDIINTISQRNLLAPIYFGVMDDDAINLKRGTGLFTRFDQTIRAYNNPSAVTHGYSVIEPNRPLIELGVRLDMVCRAAMNSIFSYSAYFPEPGSLFCVKRPNGIPTLPTLSFIGDGQALENRRLIANGLRINLLYRDGVFIADGGVTTATPNRMKTIKNGKLPVLTAQKLKNKTNLQSLRGISQSHISPKQWADNLYLALDFIVPKVTDATGPMMHLYGVYDPLSRIFNIPGKYSPNSVNTVLLSYFNPLTVMQNTVRLNARNSLINLHMSIELIDRIETAAQASGNAIARLLAHELGIPL